eukprot:14072023-Ditylum_brightwellii.AAC.1
MVSHCPGLALEVKGPNTTNLITIKYKNAYTVHKKLGHRKAPAGVNALQKTVLTDKANEYAVKGSASSLTHFEAKMYCNSCYIKPVGYVLGQSFFTDQDCKEIEQEVIQVFMSCMGYNKNMAKVIRDGPAELAGDVMTRLIDVQGTEQVKNFLRHIRSDSQAAQLVKIVVAWAQH